MSTLAHRTLPFKTERRRRPSPAALGLPDPRPVTDYSVALSTVAGHARLTVTLAQPCVIRSPNWAVIDVSTGNRTYPVSVTVLSTVQFTMDFAGALLSTIAFVEVPYQDTQVQNFQGGYCVSGGKWFRAAG
jgi:hypothetical protein